MPESTSLPTTRSGLTVEDMRHFTLDLAVENNLLDLDLTWSNKEIEAAMDRCRLMWNAVPPVIGSLNMRPSVTLPREYVFMLGTAYHMYLAKLQQYMRNDLDYTIGGVQTNTFAKRIEHFKAMLQMQKAEFTETVGIQKETQNLNNAWGVIC